MATYGLNEYLWLFEKRCFLDLIGHVSPQISQVFNSPEQVTAKLIHSCYDEQIQVFTKKCKDGINICKPSLGIYSFQAKSNEKDGC